MAFEFKGEKAVITGAGSGIGQAIACLFAKQGAEVILLEPKLEFAEATLEKVQGSQYQASAYACDVSNSSQVKEVFQTIDKNHGNIDILVNNAGIAHVGTVLNTEEEDFDKVYQVNVKGVYLCLKEAVKRMETQKKGAILNMASIASKIGIADRFAYSMSKGAVLTMTLSIAKDFVRSGIRCNCICPARIHTPFVDGFIQKNYPGKEEEVFKTLSEYQPIGRMGKPEEVANLALYLCSDESSFITGSSYDIDGGVMSLI